MTVFITVWQARKHFNPSENIFSLKSRAVGWRSHEKQDENEKEATQSINQSINTKYVYSLINADFLPRQLLTLC
jgi:hypothetical protein